MFQQCTIGTLHNALLRLLVPWRAVSRVHVRTRRLPTGTIPVESKSSRPLRKALMSSYANSPSWPHMNPAGVRASCPDLHLDALSRCCEVTCADLLGSWSVARFHHMLRQLFNFTSADLDTGPLAFDKLLHFDTPLLPNATSFRLGWQDAPCLRHSDAARRNRAFPAPRAQQCPRIRPRYVAPPLRGAVILEDLSLERALLQPVLS